MKRNCPTCRACEALEEPAMGLIGYCHQEPPRKVVYSDGALIEFVGVTAGFYCLRHKFRRWTWRWLASADFLKFWK
jgi:hypothetical protein